MRYRRPDAEGSFEAAIVTGERFNEMSVNAAQENFLPFR